MNALPRPFLAVFAAAIAAQVVSAQGAGVTGELLPGSAVSPVVVESMADIEARDRAAVRSTAPRRIWHGQDGRWIVPTINMAVTSHSGSVAVVNEWGDPRMGLGFGRLVDVERLWLAGHGSTPARTVEIVGYRRGNEVARVELAGLEVGLSREFEVDLQGVDRIEFVAGPAGRFAYYALDDLAFRPHASAEPLTFLDFEDLAPRAVLSRSRYAGLDWEDGSGLRLGREGPVLVDAPQRPAADPQGGSPFEDESYVYPNLLPTQPGLNPTFRGQGMGVSGGFPPDSCAAAGPDHVVSMTNFNLTVWNKSTGRSLVSVGLQSFWQSSSLVTGDPRIQWDSMLQRFIAVATDFTGTRSIYFAISSTPDATGSWIKFSIRTDIGSDAGRWPDYPTLGFDQQGIYTSAYMVGSGDPMTLWAIDKAWLQTPTPGTPRVTAFRSLPWEGAIQPCATQTPTDPIYFVSSRSTSQLRLRRIQWVAGNPVLFEQGTVSIPTHNYAPDAPALGSTIPLSTIDDRPMNAVSRGGRIYTAQTISVNGRCGVRWYEINAANRAVLQLGTIADPVWHYFFGSIAIDATGAIAVGFSGSHAGAYASAFVTARRPADPAGQMAAPVLMQAGLSPWEIVDGYGRNRWGDYSTVAIDGTDGVGLWTIQEYAGPGGDNWQTWISRVAFEVLPYGSGTAGTRGIPTLTARTRPVIGTQVELMLSMSAPGFFAPGVLILGLNSAGTPTFGGTLLVQPDILHPVSIGIFGTQVNLPIPNTPAAVGASVFCQSVQVDAGAPQGFAFTAGLEIVPVPR